MGSALSRIRSDYVVYVATGDKKHSGTDANVKIILKDEEGIFTEEIKLDNFFKNDFESGKLDAFHIPRVENQRLGKIAEIEFWRDSSGLGSAWFVDRIIVENHLINTSFIFPVYRWIKAGRHYVIKHLDTSLPQLDEHKEQRGEDLADKKKNYEYSQKAPGMPVQVKSLPEDEMFSFDYRWDIIKTKVKLLAKSKIVNIKSDKWSSLDDLKNVYDKKALPLPRAWEGWKDDLYFASQRVAGVNHSLIQLCTAIPTKLAVTGEMLKPLLEGNSLQYLLDEKRIFICDLEILDELKWKDGYVVCSPIALFMVDNNQELRPLAIQLFQIPAEDNPVFLPTDDTNLWFLAKMWYNNADGTYHQSLTHLGFTHLLMEGVAIAANRNISQSHPIYKILAPHFLYLIAINNRALQLLISEGGWIDKTMNSGAKGLVGLVLKGVDRWQMDVDGNLKEDLKKRGLDDPSVLPGYHFREDGLLLFDAIKTYSSTYVELYYDTDDKISGDWELQNFAKELALAKNQGGVGIKGMPNHGVFKTKEDIVDVVMCVIYTCSVMHAAANFPQYEAYAFPPNYPATMKGIPPKNKEPINGKLLLDTLATKDITLDIMVVTKILSNKGTQSLGDFEVQYIFDPKAQELVAKFRSELKNISKIIKERNKGRKIPYVYLDPDCIPNSIGI